MRRVTIGPSAGTFFWVFLTCLLASSPRGWVEAAVNAVAPVPVPRTMVDLANADRARLGRSTLLANENLMRAAQLHADQMARVGELQHVLTKATFPRPEDRLAEAIYRWRTYGENIAMGQSTPARVQESWMASTKHRDNILNAAFIELGTGFATDAQGRPYYVQVFGTPRQ
jgi:uncharacterized protein YkwD